MLLLLLSNNVTFTTNSLFVITHGLACYFRQQIVSQTSHRKGPFYSHKRYRIENISRPIENHSKGKLIENGQSLSAIDRLKECL